MIVDGYGGLDLKQTRARLCRPDASLLDASAGMYQLALEYLKVDDGFKALEVLRTSALDLATPYALVKLAKFEFHGTKAVNEAIPNIRIRIEEPDLGAAYVHADAAFLVGGEIARRTGNGQIVENLTWPSFAIIDSYNAPDIAAAVDDARAEHDLSAQLRVFETLYGASEFPTAPAIALHAGPSSPSARNPK